MMSIDAYGIHIGFLYFRFYGIIIMFGVIVAALLARRLMKEIDKDPELVWDALIWVLILGAIGARLYHVFTPSKSMIEQGFTTSYYLTHPLEILMTWQGGLGWPGALIGGFLGLYIFARRRKISLGILADIGAPGVSIAHAIGRWGNFVNQELYGPPCDLPWCISIRPENRMLEYRQFERFHPLFLYESLWNLANGVFLLWLWRKQRTRLKDGDIFVIYLMNYSFGRFLLEFIRLDFVPLYGINLNQMVFLAVVIGGGILLLLRHRLKKEVPA
jgi:phosphatidylglycerol:prolipoprotein diacylglycerol transferase